MEKNNHRLTLEESINIKLEKVLNEMTKIASSLKAIIATLKLYVFNLIFLRQC